MRKLWIWFQFSFEDGLKFSNLFSASKWLLVVLEMFLSQIDHFLTGSFFANEFAYL